MELVEKALAKETNDKIRVKFSNLVLAKEGLNSDDKEQATSNRSKLLENLEIMTLKVS